MAHAFCGVLIATACLYCLRGIRSGSLSLFAFMLVPLLISFQLKDRSRAYCNSGAGRRRIADISTRATATRRGCSHDRRDGSLGLWLRSFTITSITPATPGFHPMRMERGLSVPVKVTASPDQIFGNLKSMWRLSGVQLTVMYSFPFVFPLAIYGFWSDRHLGLDPASGGSLPRRSCSSSGTDRGLGLDHRRNGIGSKLIRPRSPRGRGGPALSRRAISPFKVATGCRHHGSQCGAIGLMASAAYYKTDRRCMGDTRGPTSR